MNDIKHDMILSAYLFLLWECNIAQHLRARYHFITHAKHNLFYALAHVRKFL